jgi:hypothetical protein
MRRIELYNAIPSIECATRWAKERGLLSSQNDCPVCHQAMDEVPNICSDGKIWKCSRMINGLRHYRKLSIRTGSIFANSNMSIRDILFTMYEWSIKTRRDDTAYQMNIERKTVGNWFKICSGIASFMVDKRVPYQIGDEDTIVEIDECQVGRRKSHRGRIPKECWVFGGLVRGSSPQVCFIEIVSKRNERTLTEVIGRRIHARARIISDGWSAYKNLRRLGYNHNVVNHSENFVNPLDSTIHTQGIENLWKCLRNFLNTKGSYSRKHISCYIKEFIFRKYFIDHFECLLSGIEQKYKPSNL